MRMNSLFAELIHIDMAGNHIWYQSTTILWFQKNIGFNCVSFILLLFSCMTVSAQESPVSAFTAEMEDSISSLSIKPLKSSRTRELLKQVIRRFGQDVQQEREVGKYQIEATFSRENLSPFSVCRTVSAKAGVALNRNDVSSAMYAFDYNGAHELNRQDSIYIARYLNQFAQLSPDHVPYISPVSMSRRTPYTSTMWIHLGNALLPLRDYSTTMQYYRVTAYSIEDASGRGVYRFVFTRNKESRLFKYAGKKYDVGEVTGTAYFDSHTLCLTQFKGNARLPSDKHVIHIKYQIDYERMHDEPVLRQNRILLEAGGTAIKASVQRLDE